MKKIIDFCSALCEIIIPAILFFGLFAILINVLLTSVQR
jgi:hypothetical protein